jgi:hypothetical protein
MFFEAPREKELEAMTSERNDCDDLLFRLRDLTEKAEAGAKSKGNWGLARDILKESVSLQVVLAKLQRVQEHGQEINNPPSRQPDGLQPR